MWDRQSDPLSGLQVDHQLKLRRLLDRKIGRLGSFEDLVHVIRYAPLARGNREKGQIWKLTPSAFDGTSDEKKNSGYLELYLEPNDADLLENADNITVPPRREICVCEDGTVSQHIVGITQDGALF